MPLILGTNSIKDTGYNVANSLRFDDGSSDNLTKTPSSDGNKRTWTWSGWVKKSKVPQWGGLFQAGNSTNITDIYFYSDGTLTVRDWNGSSLAMYLITNRLFRDPSAWYHIVVAVDTTQSTASDRVKIYVNGTQETSFSTETYPSQNLDTNFNDTNHQNILGGVYQIGGSLQYYDGYMAEVVFIDGSQLTPTSFGEFDEDSPNIWKPIDVSGLTFGTNGFYLDFEDSSALGNDKSGNDNDFTVGNLTSVDQSTDTCTNNFATLNPIDKGYTGTITLSEGNLVTESSSGAGDYGLRATLGVSQGKWYLEAKMATYNTIVIGDINARLQANMNDGSPADDFYGVQRYDDTKTNIYNDGNFDQFNTSMWGGFTSSDIISIALDLDNNKIFFAKNGSYKDTSGNTGDPANGTNPTMTISDTTKTYTFYTELRGNDNDGTLVNFGGTQSFSISSGNSDGNGYGNFEYSVPSGYYALNTKNLAEYG
jgi:hypothetical protein